jgi:hypothetical protein
VAGPVVHVAGVSCVESEPGRIRADPVEAGPDRFPRRRREACGLAHRHRAREVRLPLDDLRPPPYEGPRGIGAAARTAWRAIASAGAPCSRASNPIALTQQGLWPRCRWSRRDSSNCPARRWKPSTRPAPRSNAHLARGEAASATSWRSACWAWASAQLARAEMPVDAQGPLQDHARIHAQARRLWPGHDVAHLHRAGEPGFRLRSRHGEEIPRVLALQPIATALFANSPFTEGPAQRLPELPFAGLDRHRPGPHRHAALRLRDGFGFERYVDYALDVPMYFVYRDGKYIDGSAELPRVPGRPIAGSRATLPRC